MLTNLISMRPTGTSATALVWQPTARKQRAAVAGGVPCPNYLPSETVGGVLVRGFAARLEGGLFDGRSDNQD